MASKYIIDPHRVTSKVREHLEIKHGVECISLKDVVLKYASGFIPDMKKLLANFSLPDAFLSNFPMWFRSHKSLLGQFTKQSLGKHIPEIAPIIKAYDLCLKSEPIALIMLWNDVTPLTKSLTFVAKKYGIPTLHVNHGIQGGGWVHDKIWADKIAVYGERCKRTYLRQGNAKSKIVVTGNPYWGDWRPGKPNELKKIRDSLGLNRHKKILLYAPTWYHNFATNEDPLLREKMDLSLLLNTLRELDKPEELDLVIKIHPDLDNKKLLYERALRKLNLPGKIVTGMSPLPLLQVADAVISAGGMVYEAALLGKTVLLYHPDHSSSDLHGEPKELETYLMRQVSACLIKGPDDLSTALRKVHAGKTEIPTERWKTFLRDINGPSDGKATERVAKLALEMAHKRSAKPFLSPVNFQKFSKTYYESARKDLPAMINGEPEKILEIGCAAGGMGEFVKQKFDCVYIGLEINADVARMAEEGLDHVIVADVEEIELEDYDIDEKSLDYIIMGDVLEHLHDPWTVLYKCGRYLKDDGYILASIPNIRNLNIINRLVQGFFTYKDEGILDSTHLRFFTLHEIKNMFANAGYRIENVEQIRTNIGVNLNTLEEKTTLGSENLILKDLSKDDVAELSTVQFCIKAQKENFLENNVAPLETMVTIIIPVFNQLKFTKNCLEALDKNTPKKLYDLVVVDNGSTDGTQEFLNSLNEAATIITNKENIGFAKACNQGARVAATKYLVFLNNDTLPQEGWLEAMVSLAESDGDIGIVGSKLLFPDGSIQHAGVVISDRGLGYHIYRGCPGDIACANKQRDFSVVTAACMLIRRGLFIDIEGFDEHYLNGCEDIDLCLKVKKKDKRIVYAPESVLIHFEGQTEGREKYMNYNRRLFMKNWPNLVRDDNEFLEDDGMQAIVEPDGSFKFCSHAGTPQIKISIILVTFNSIIDIQPCIQSIKKNTVFSHEIIIVDNNSTDGTPQFLKTLSGVKVIQNNENNGFSKGCNQGIKAAGGEYIVLLNPDTMVTNGWDEKLHAHFKEGVGAVGPVSNYVAGLQKFELYRQEAINDKIDINHLAEKLYLWNRGNGVRTKLLTGFCMMIKKEIVDKVGMLDENLFLGSDDLEYSWRLQNNGYRLVVATDTFIYHKGQASFKSEPEPKMTQLTQESQNALYAKLETHYGQGNVPSSYELWGMDWFKPSSPAFTKAKLSSIVILTHNQIEFTKKCLESIYRHTSDPFELIIVDNGSSDGTPDYLEREVAGRKSCAEVKIIRNSHNVGFAAGNNQGIAAASGDFIILLNNDVVVTRDWLRRLTRCADQNPGCGIVGPRTNFIAGPQRMGQVSYDQNSLDGLDEYANQLANEFRGKSSYSWRLVGFCMLITREVINKIGGLDPRYGLGNFEDDDFCIRLNMAGFRGRIAEDCFVHHFGGKTFKGAGIDYQISLNRNWEIFKRKWGIPQNTPLNSAYTVIPPKDGFDPVKHFYPLPVVSPTQQSNPAAPTSGQNASALQNTDFSKCEAKQNKDIQLEYVNAVRPLNNAKKPYEIIYQSLQRLMDGSSPVDAIAALSNLVNSFPDFAQAHNDLGVLYLQSGEKDKALKHYEKAAQLEPGNAIFQKNLANLQPNEKAARSGF